MVILLSLFFLYMLFALVMMIALAACHENWKTVIVWGMLWPTYLYKLVSHINNNVNEL
jgi:hypothetical protein